VANLKERSGEKGDVGDHANGRTDGGDVPVAKKKVSMLAVLMPGVHFDFCGFYYLF